MGKYSYVARGTDGKDKKGSAVATDEAELQQMLHADGLMLISAREDYDKIIQKSLKANQISDFCRQIGTLVGSGVSLVRALSIISQQETIKPHERATYQMLLRSVRQGIPLSNAMESAGGAFPDLLISMIQSAEASGNVDKVALRMATHYDKEWHLKKKIKSAMTYPKILSGLIVLVVIIIMTFVIPKFEELFSQMESLPITTEILLAISRFLASYWLFTVLGCGMAVVTIRIIVKHPVIKYKLDKMKIHLPLIGPLQKTVITSRFARSLSSLYSSGMSIVGCLEIAKNTIDNSYVEQQFDNVIAQVRKGENLSTALSEVDGLTKKLEFSIKVGEETGALDSMLDSIADSLEFESENAISQMVSYIEPLMIVLMGLIIGFVMLSVLLPIYGGYNAIGKEA